MSINLRETVVNYLRDRPDERFTTRQIAQWIFEHHRVACEEKRSRSRQDLSDDGVFLQQLSAEISTIRLDIQKHCSKVKTTEDRPRCYFYTNSSDEAVVAIVERRDNIVDPQPDNTNNQLERDLYPLLSQYLFSQLSVFPKRIDERRSSNRNGPSGNEWLYPDLVGMEDLSKDWHVEIKNCVKECGAKRVRLWSFEVKLLLNRSNVRKAFFQTVSNSSWANFGYLVAKEIQNDDTMKTRMLSAAHGIGIISLKQEDPGDSQILLPARERFDIDWDACNRLADENTDFKFFLQLVRQFHQTGDHRKRDWSIPDPMT